MDSINKLKKEQNNNTIPKSISVWVDISDPNNTKIPAPKFCTPPNKAPAVPALFLKGSMANETDKGNITPAPKKYINPPSMIDIVLTWYNTPALSIINEPKTKHRDDASINL